MALLDALLLEPAPFEVWISYRLDGVMGSGTASDPWDGHTSDLFDSRMREIPANTRVHLGPSPRDAIGANVQPFQTRGYADGVSGAGETFGWQLKSGLKITGAGMDVTVLQLVGASVQHKHYYAMAHSLKEGTHATPMDHVEIADLTINANLDEQPAPVQIFGEIACGAIRIMGSHCRVRRVKAVGWGTYSNLQVGHAIKIIGASADPEILETVNAGIEDCIAIMTFSDLPPGTDFETQPGATAFSVESIAHPTTGVQAIAKSPFLRNNLASQGDPGPTPHLTSTLPLVRGLAMSGCRGGVVEGNHVHNCWIGGPYVEKTGTKDIVVRSNFFKNVVSAAFWKLGGLGVLTGSVTITRLAGSATVTITTPFTHNLYANAWIKLQGAPTGYNGYFRISQIPTATTFEFIVTRPSGTVNSTCQYQVVNLADKIVVERNVIELADLDASESAHLGLTAPVAVLLSDADTESTAPNSPFAFGDVIIRDNKIRYIDGKTRLLSGQPLAGTGIQTKRAQNAIIQNNVLEIIPTNPIQTFRCGSVNCFNNRSPSGVLVDGFNADAGYHYEELETDTQFAAILALFRPLNSQ